MFVQVQAIREGPAHKEQLRSNRSSGIPASATKLCEVASAGLRLASTIRASALSDRARRALTRATQLDDERVNIAAALPDNGLVV